MDNLSALNPVYAGNHKRGYAVLLPAITYGFHRDREDVNFFSDDAAFTYKWGLVSAGQFLSKNLQPRKDAMIDQRDREATFLLADSGGFQIAKGTWQYDIRNATAAERKALCSTILDWQVDHIGADVAVTLDIPTEAVLRSKGTNNEDVTFDDCLKATLEHHRIWEKLLSLKKNCKTKFLNVMQGDSPSEREEWYNGVKGVSYTEGWAISLRAFGASTKYEELFAAIMRFISWLKSDGLLSKCKHIHFLGETSLRTGMALTVIMRSLQKHSPGLLITFDSSTPMVDGGRFGKVYHTWGFGTQVKHKYGVEDKVVEDDEHYAADIVFDREPTKAWIDKHQLSDITDIPQDLPFWFVTSPVGRDLKIRDLAGGKGNYGLSSIGTAIIQAHNTYIWLLANLQMNRLLEHHLSSPGVYDLPIEYDQFQKAVDKVLKAKNYNRVIVQQSELLHFMNQKMLPMDEIESRMNRLEGKRPLLEAMSKSNSDAGQAAKTGLESQKRIIDDETECYDLADLESADA